MTRINTIDPTLLLDQHLMAEYRELPMIHAALKRSLNSKGGFPDIPSTYPMGPGHVKFFYDKGQYLQDRYAAICTELRIRCYNIDPDRPCPFDLFKENGLMYDWEPTAEDRAVNVERLLEKVEMRPDFYKYYGEPITPSEYIELLEEFGEL